MVEETKKRKHKRYELFFAPYTSPADMGSDKKLKDKFDSNRRVYSSMGEAGWELIGIDKTNPGVDGVLIFQREMLD